MAACDRCTSPKHMQPGPATRWHIASEPAHCMCRGLSRCLPPRSCRRGTPERTDADPWGERPRMMSSYGSSLGTLCWQAWRRRCRNHCVVAWSRETEHPCQRRRELLRRTSRSVCCDARNGSFMWYNSRDAPHTAFIVVGRVHVTSLRCDTEGDATAVFKQAATGLPTLGVRSNYCRLLMPLPAVLTDGGFDSSSQQQRNTQAPCLCLYLFIVTCDSI